MVGLLHSAYNQYAIFNNGINLEDDKEEEEEERNGIIM